jgi:hypothetical protein
LQLEAAFLEKKPEFTTILKNPRSAIGISHQACPANQR